MVELLWDLMLLGLAVLGLGGFIHCSFSHVLDAEGTMTTKGSYIMAIEVLVVFLGAESIALFAELEVVFIPKQQTLVPI